VDDIYPATVRFLCLTIAAVFLLLPACTAGAAARTNAVKPRVVWKPIPFPLRRKLETRAYAERHYGVDTWRLRQPRVIVEHYTASDSFTSAYATFSADVPDSELHELPGTCAHFVVDRDGTIYQLVALGVMCRHTVGLNWTAIGIENVGTSDGAILANKRQLAASLALTAWLMSRFHIPLGDVIGHNESLTSPFHRELYPAWRCQTHGDWARAGMTVYRSRLAALARRERIPLGKPVRQVATRC
jgi:N-acetylmuramoyl-L-alanine amidase